MADITATLFGVDTPQLVQLAVTGLAGATDVNVWAEPPAMPRRIVRGGYDVDPASDALVLIDPMPELGRPIIYVVEWTGTRTNLSTRPTFTDGSEWSPASSVEPGGAVSATIGASAYTANYAATAGQLVSYSLTVTNIDTVARTFSVTHRATIGGAFQAGDSPAPTTVTVQPGASHTFTGQRTIPATYNGHRVVVYHTAAPDKFVMSQLLVEHDQPAGYPFIVGAVVGVWQRSAPSVTVPDPGRHVLSDPFTGEAVLVDVILDDDERTAVQRGSTLWPVGSSMGVALIDGRTADAGTLTVYTRDRGDTAALVELLSSGRPLVSRHPNDGCDIDALEVLSVGDAARRRRTRSGDRLFSLPFSLAVQPDPTLVLAVVELADIAAYYEPSGTLSTLDADTTTLLDIATREWVA